MFYSRNDKYPPQSVINNEFQYWKTSPEMFSNTGEETLVNISLSSEFQQKVWSTYRVDSQSYPREERGQPWSNQRRVQSEERKYC